MTTTESRAGFLPAEDIGGAPVGPHAAYALSQESTRVTPKDEVLRILGAVEDPDDSASAERGYISCEEGQADHIGTVSAVPTPMTSSGATFPARSERKNGQSELERLREEISSKEVKLGEIEAGRERAIKKLQGDYDTAVSADDDTRRQAQIRAQSIKAAAQLRGDAIVRRAATDGAQMYSDAETVGNSRITGTENSVSQNEAELARDDLAPERRAFLQTYDSEKKLAEARTFADGLKQEALNEGRAIVEAARGESKEIRQKAQARADEHVRRVDAIVDAHLAELKKALDEGIKMCNSRAKSDTRRINSELSELDKRVDQLTGDKNVGGRRSHGNNLSPQEGMRRAPSDRRHPRFVRWGVGGIAISVMATGIYVASGRSDSKTSEASDPGVVASGLTTQQLRLDAAKNAQLPNMGIPYSVKVWQKTMEEVLADRRIEYVRSGAHYNFLSGDGMDMAQGYEQILYALTLLSSRGNPENGTSLIELDPQTLARIGTEMGLTASKDPIASAKNDLLINARFANEQLYSAFTDPKLSAMFKNNSTAMYKWLITRWNVPAYTNPQTNITDLFAGICLDMEKKSSSSTILERLVANPGWKKLLDNAASLISKKYPSLAQGNPQ